MGCSPWGCRELDTTERLALSLFRGIQLIISVVVKVIIVVCCCC